MNVDIVSTRVWILTGSVCLMYFSGNDVVILNSLLGDRLIISKTDELILSSESLSIGASQGQVYFHVCQLVRLEVLSFSYWVELKIIKIWRLNSGFWWFIPECADDDDDDSCDITALMLLVRWLEGQSDGIKSSNFKQFTFAEFANQSISQSINIRLLKGMTECKPKQHKNKYSAISSSLVWCARMAQQRHSPTESNICMGNDHLISVFFLTWSNCWNMVCHNLVFMSLILFINQIIFVHKFIICCYQAEKKLSGVEWNSVSDKAERQLGQRLWISHAKVPHAFLTLCYFSLIFTETLWE